MKICLIGPGIMPIPPPGWGAVEIIIWDYYIELKKQGCDVDIINKIRNNPNDQSSPFTSYCQELINEINSKDYDFVHLHYDCLYHIMPFLRCNKIAITSHYPYIDKIEKHKGDGYEKILNEICKNNNHYIFALSKKDYNTFYKFCCDKTKIFISLNGANHNEIYPLNNEILYSDKSIYLAKIEERKKQYIYCNLANIDFYGKCDNYEFSKLNCFKGEAKRYELNSILNSYGNMVLLSGGENGTPLALKEGLMAGLPIVINNNNIDDLDLSLSFIDVIPDEKLNDFLYIEDIIKKNLKKRNLTKQIREYAIKNFSWEHIINVYIKNIKFIL